MTGFEFVFSCALVIGLFLIILGTGMKITSLVKFFAPLNVFERKFVSEVHCVGALFVAVGLTGVAISLFLS